MKVNSSDSTPIQGSETSAAAQAKAKARATAQANKEAKAGSSEGAKAEISAKGREVANAKAAASAAPEVREEKIAELKRKIAAGSYKVDAEAVADKMVDEHLSAGIG